MTDEEVLQFAKRQLGSGCGDLINDVKATLERGVLIVPVDARVLLGLLVIADKFITRG